MAALPSPPSGGRGGSSRGLVAAPPAEMETMLSGLGLDSAVDASGLVEGVARMLHRRVARLQRDSALELSRRDARVHALEREVDDLRRALAAAEQGKGAAEAEGATLRDRCRQLQGDLEKAATRLKDAQHTEAQLKRHAKTVAKALAREESRSAAFDQRAQTAVRAQHAAEHERDGHAKNLGREAARRVEDRRALAEAQEECKQLRRATLQAESVARLAARRATYHRNFAEQCQLETSLQR